MSQWSLNVNIKVEPSSGTEVKSILPPNFETIFSEMTKPKPMPFVFI